MKKFYSIVLMATALLIGTNTWANEAWDNLPTTQGANKISVTIGGVTKYAANLQAAVDAVNENEAATITLLGDQELTATVLIPNYLNEDTVSTSNPDGVAPIRTRKLQDITLDLNGFNITEQSGKKIGLIQLVKGRLHITGEGELRQTHAKGGDNIDRSVIFVSGAPYANKNEEWSTLIIDENVFLNATGKVNESDVTTGDVAKNYGITVDILLKKGDKNSIGYVTAASKTGSTVAANVDDNGASFSDANIKCWAKGGWNDPKTTWSKKEAGCAYGVKVIVKGKIYGNMRAINFSGNINAKPECDESWTTKGRRYSKPANEGRYYDNFYPYVKIESTATLWCLADGLTDGNGAIYAGGYGVWDVSGNIHGQTGILVKSGDVKLIDAIVKSDSQHSANSGEYHGEVSGTGVFIASDQSYAGGVAVEITGDTKVTGGGSAAIVDAYATNSTETQVSNLSITGGTIEPGAQGGITLTTGTAAATQATGGNIQGDIKINGSETTVSAIVPATGYHTTTIKDENNKDVIVITPGAAPTGYATVAGNDGKSVKWTGASETISADLELKELEINEATAQVLTIAAGKTLKVGRVVLGKNAQIIVEAGAKFIVTGEQGIVAPVVSNIVLKASESAQAYFLFRPSVTSNRHPKATVEFISNGYFKSSTDYANQRFGIPAAGALEQITTKYEGSDVATGFGSFDGNSWNVIGFINNPSQPAMDYAKMAEPFAYYQMQHNASNVGTVVTMKGALYGNESPVLNIQGSRWNGFANSFMAPIDGETLINKMIPNTVDKTFYLYDITTAQSVWKSYTLLNINKQGGIRPMQPFLIRNTMSAADVKVDYGDAVYYPLTGETKPGAAPAPRRAINNITMVEMSVNGENTYDELIVAEDAQFSAEFDNGYDAVKYMNEGINMYVSTDEKMSIFATDNLENTYVGFQSVKGGNYTIEFTDVRGEELTLIDHETGARVAMVEGATYEFNADANTVNDYRFEIVGRANMPTAIDNTEAVKSAKGVYTITGQYVGEMNVWNTLPAGVYVVNGEKRVK